MPGESFPKGYHGLANTENGDDSLGVEIAVPEEKTEKGFEFIKKLSIEAGKRLANAFVINQMSRSAI